MDENIFLKKLNSICHVFANAPMSSYTTFKAGGLADYLLMPANIEQLVLAIKLLRQENIPYLILGRGSNVLFSDNGFPGAVIRLTELNTIGVNGNLITADSGVILPSLVSFAHANHLCGLEELFGIPASVGGAVVMNAGAYGLCVKDVLVSATLLTPDLQVITKSANALDLDYRHSNIYANNEILLSAVFNAEQGDIAPAKRKLEKLTAVRKQKQPLNYPSAGSVFKRPDGYFAGQLIEQTGLKGFKLGGAMVSEKHAGFIINTGNASAHDIYLLIELVRKRVYDAKGIMLECEIKFMGEML